MAKEAKVESKTKNIINIVIMTIEILIIIAGIVLSATVIFGSKTKADELGKGYNITTVLSDSMDGNVTTEFEIPSFRPKADLLIVKAISQEEAKELKVGDVITYTGLVGGEMQLISHRITKIEEKDLADDHIFIFYTLGDKQRTGSEEIDIAISEKVYIWNIQGVVIKKISGLGNIVFWFQDSTHFLLAVVIPLALLLAYNIYLFIRMIVDYRIKKAKEEGQLAVEAIKAQNALNEEEIRKKAIEEYLAQQKAQNGIQDAPNSEEIVEDVKSKELKEDK
ncbi:MAG: hypothetical protein E7338_06850 [Clostridiales bacterium]|nr:hypothetical protein [Clostridiales bacterium]